MFARLTIIALITVVALTALPAQASAPAGATPAGPADFTCDSHFDAKDSLALATFLSGLDPGTPAGCPAIRSVVSATNGKIVWEHKDDIWTMNADGANQVNLTDTPDFHYYPVWSHDGTHIVFSSDSGPGDKYHLYIMDADGANQRQLTTGNSRDDYIATWSPDDSMLAFDSYSDHENAIFTINFNGTGRENITSSYSGSSVSPNWSPDGERIAFASDRDGTYVDMYSMKPNGTDVQPLILDDVYKCCPVYSPDGTAIVYSRITPSTHTDIFVATAGGSNPINITQSDASREYGATWAPEANLLVFSTDRDEPNPTSCTECNREIYTITPGGASLHRLTNLPGTDEDPNWQPIPSIVRGDLNCDGVVDLKDLIVSLALAAGVPKDQPAGCPPITT